MGITHFVPMPCSTYILSVKSIYSICATDYITHLSGWVEEAVEDVPQQPEVLPDQRTTMAVLQQEADRLRHQLRYVALASFFFAFC